MTNAAYRLHLEKQHTRVIVIVRAILLILFSYVENYAHGTFLNTTLNITDESQQKKTWCTHDETNSCSEVKRNAQKEEGDLLKQLYNISIIV